MKKEFKLEKCLYAKNPVYIAGLLDPLTARMARFTYNVFGLSANMTTVFTFIFGLLGIFAMYYYPAPMGFIVAAILITIRNLGDTIDGKIARGTDTFSAVGGFSDIVSDWIFFHAGFFIILGMVTGHIIIGFLCVTGYMSREFTRRMFTLKYGEKITDTSEAKEISGIVSLVRKYDLGSLFWIIPIWMVIHPVSILYFTLIMEYGLLFGELAFDYMLFFKMEKNKSKEIEKNDEAHNLIESVEEDLEPLSQPQFKTNEPPQSLTE
ncbi:hypothetical protein CMI43_01270 [Candidatus Pacearchaeota archaeon]|nr:hypothetical protein [Candidatus Pacearchaeota archaeon]|tara:strand:+ start:247 stop:1041 length:795 start_codon:yes stop_codon:yes gene_type:complete